MTKKNIWTVHHPSGWAVKREGGERAIRVTKTQQEANKIGRDIAKKDGVDHIIQGENGKIISKDSYGNDPIPPKDTEH